MNDILDPRLPGTLRLRIYDVDHNAVVGNGISPVVVSIYESNLRVYIWELERLLAVVDDNELVAMVVADAHMVGDRVVFAGSKGRGKAFIPFNKSLSTRVGHREMLECARI